MPPHTPLPPFAATHGPRDAPVVLVGEAWGEQEEKGRRPFLGSSGTELARMLTQAGLGPSLPPREWLTRDDLWDYWRRSGFLVTNVLAARPPANDILTWCTTKKELPHDYTMPPLSQGKYLRPEYLPELQRLHTELAAYPRTLILALGSTALWACLGTAAISSNRGVVHPSPWGKILPTFHPSAVLRQWSLRPIVLADFLKALRESDFPEIRRPSRSILISPTLTEAQTWAQEAASAPAIACDIETANKQITCVGFSRSNLMAMVVPFYDGRHLDGAYWPSLDSEIAAWRIVKGLLEGPQVKVFQNGLYDLQYLTRMGIQPRNCTSDTMLLHHALYPELQKGLGFLASLYADEGAWKLMRKHTEELKRDE